jgi:para-nitrobenzyl esterase
VFTPKSAFPSGSKPVMVFIHGGGNVVGSAREEVEPGRALYDGSAIAQSTGNVVVTLQYRLGPLGWLVHPGLDAEAADARSGNYALEDMIAALKWVQKDIGEFGGDKTHVMIFGESAGGINVCALLAAPGAAGLFKSAAIESGACLADTRDQALATGTIVATNAGCATAADVVACLRSKTAAEIVQAYPPDFSVATTRSAYQPSVDGTVLPAAPLDAIRGGQHNRVPTVIGTNADETAKDVPLGFTELQYQAILLSYFPNAIVRAQVADLYSSTNFGSARLAYIALTSDLKFICPARTIARALDAAQSEPVYRYFLTEVPDAAGAAPFGSFHGLELLYLFGALDVMGYTPTAAERSLSTAMQSYWGGLAASGVPAAVAGAPAWTAYDPARDNYLRLDSAALAMADGVNSARCDFWAGLGV